MLQPVLFLVFVCVLSGWAAEQEKSETSNQDRRDFNRLRVEDRFRSPVREPDDQTSSQNYVQSGYNSPGEGARIITLRNGARALVRGNPPLEIAPPRQQDLPTQTLRSHNINVAVPQRQATYQSPVSTLPYQNVGYDDILYRSQVANVPGGLPNYGQEYGNPYAYNHQYPNPHLYGPGMYEPHGYHPFSENPYLYRRRLYRMPLYDQNYLSPYYRSYHARYPYYNEPLGRGIYDDQHYGYDRDLTGYSRVQGGYSPYYGYYNSPYGYGRHNGLSNNGLYETNNLLRNSLYPTSIQDQLDSQNSYYGRNINYRFQQPQDYNRDYSNRAQTTY